MKQRMKAFQRFLGIASPGCARLAKTGDASRFGRNFFERIGGYRCFKAPAHGFARRDSALVGLPADRAMARIDIHGRHAVMAGESTLSRRSSLGIRSESPDRFLLERQALEIISISVVARAVIRHVASVKQALHSE